MQTLGPKLKKSRASSQYYGYNLRKKSRGAEKPYETPAVNPVAVSNGTPAFLSLCVLVTNTRHTERKRSGEENRVL